MRGMTFSKPFYLLLCGLMLAAGGCATAPAKPDAVVESAREAYAVAAGRPHVQEYAPIPLREAYLNLKRAEEAESSEARAHFAYLTKRQAALALAMTERRIAEDEIEQLTERRDSLAFESQRKRTKEAEMEAERLRRESELADEEAEKLRRQSETAQRETERLRQELAEFKARETDRGLVMTLDNVLFETNSAELKPGAFRSLEKIGRYIKQNPDRSILVEGHTDSTGSAGYNLELSRRRANAVAQALRFQGIGPERIESRGFGREYPVASNDTAAGRLQNRRVEVIIGHPGEIRAGTGRR